MIGYKAFLQPINISISCLQTQTISQFTFRAFNLIFSTIMKKRISVEKKEEFRRKSFWSPFLLTSDFVLLQQDLIADSLFTVFFPFTFFFFCSLNSLQTQTKETVELRGFPSVKTQWYMIMTVFHSTFSHHFIYSSFFALILKIFRITPNGSLCTQWAVTALLEYLIKVLNTNITVFLD